MKIKKKLILNHEQKSAHSYKHNYLSKNIINNKKYITKIINPLRKRNLPF